jgi:hypothetical protein
MTGFNYTRAAATAKRLIARFGRVGSYIEVTNSGTEYSPTLSKADPVAVTFVDLDQELRDASGSLVGQSVRTLYVSTGQDVTPKKGDLFVIDAVDLRVDRIKPLAPGGDVVFWEVYIEA